MENRKAWGAFFALSIMWGTSFLFIKIALQTLHPMTLVALRLLIGLIALVIIAWVQKLSWPPRSLWKHFAVIGLINTALPFLLFSWAESGPNGVNSGVASVLNGTVPLFTILLSGFMLRLERVTRAVLVGLLLGFLGMVIIFSGKLLNDSWGSLLPLLACMGASLLYSIASVYIKRNIKGVDPIMMGASQLLLADLYITIAALGLESRADQSLTWPTVGALLWLGVLGSGFAYICYFYLLHEWGPTRTTMVTYVMPVVGVTSGILFLNEPFDGRIVLGGGLILLGVWVVNLRNRVAKGA